jgi:hypothetical protein
MKALTRVQVDSYRYNGFLFPFGRQLKRSQIPLSNRRVPITAVSHIAMGDGGH